MFQIIKDLFYSRVSVLPCLCVTFLNRFRTLIQSCDALCCLRNSKSCSIRCQPFFDLSSAFSFFVLSIFSVHKSKHARHLDLIGHTKGNRKEKGFVVVLDVVQF